MRVGSLTWPRMVRLLLVVRLCYLLVSVCVVRSWPMRIGWPTRWRLLCTSWARIRLMVRVVRIRRMMRLILLLVRMSWKICTCRRRMVYLWILRWRLVICRLNCRCRSYRVDWTVRARVCSVALTRMRTLTTTMTRWTPAPLDRWGLKFSLRLSRMVSRLSDVCSNGARMSCVPRRWMSKSNRLNETEDI